MNDVVKKLTGTGGETPLADGTMRGAISGFIMAGILFASTIIDITAEQMAALGTLVTFGTFIAFGIFDASNREPKGSPDA